MHFVTFQTLKVRENKAEASLKLGLLYMLETRRVALQIPNRVRTKAAHF